MEQQEVQLQPKGYLKVQAGGVKVGNIEYTVHVLHRMDPTDRAITHDEVEALLRKSNIKVIGGIETNSTLAIQEKDNPGSLIVRIICSELSKNIIKIQTAFRPQDNRDKALALVQDAEKLIRPSNPDIDIVTSWNNAGIRFFESSTQRGEIKKNIVESLGGISKENKDSVVKLLEEALVLCNEADREESRG